MFFPFLLLVLHLLRLPVGRWASRWLLPSTLFSVPSHMLTAGPAPKTPRVPGELADATAWEVKALVPVFPFFLTLTYAPAWKKKKKKRCCWPWQAGWGQPVDGIRRTVTGITLQLSENYCGLKQAALSLQPGSQVGSLPSWRRALLGKAPRVFSSKRLKWGKQHWWLDSHLFI